MRTLRFPLPLLCLVAAMAFWTGCDTVASALGVDSVEVRPGFAASIPIRPGDAALGSSNVDFDTSDVPDIFDVESITIDPADVRYQGSGVPGAATSGTIEALFVVGPTGSLGDGPGGLPAARFAFTIENNVVTAVTPSTASLGGYGGVEPWFPGTDYLRAGYETLTVGDIARQVSDLAEGGSFDAGGAVYTEDNLAGLLTVEKLTFNLNF